MRPSGGYHLGLTLSAHSRASGESSYFGPTIFDGITRHSPEGMAFKRRAEAVG
jgi:hypothetical protein